MLTKRSAKGQTLFRKEVQQRKLPQQENEELKASHTSSSSFYQDRLEMIRVSHQEISTKLRSLLPDGSLTICWKAATVGFFFFFFIFVFLDFPISSTPRSHHHNLLHDGVNCDRTFSIILVILISI